MPNTAKAIVAHDDDGQYIGHSGLMRTRTNFDHNESDDYCLQTLSVPARYRLLQELQHVLQHLQKRSWAALAESENRTYLYAGVQQIDPLRKLEIAPGRII